MAIERPPWVAVVQAARCGHGWHTAAAKWTWSRRRNRGALLRGTDDVRGRQINREGLLGKAAAVGAGPRLRPNRHALRGEGPHAGTAQVSAIDLHFGERPMLDDVGLQQGQRVVLGLVRGAHHDPDDQIGIDEFHDMAFVAGEQLRPRFASMAHLGVAQRGQAVGGDAAPDPPLPGGRIGLQILREHAAQRRERGLHGRGLGDGHVGGHPRLHAIDLGQQPGQARRPAPPDPPNRCPAPL